MATGDKLVTLDGLKAVHDHDMEEVNSIKSAVNQISNTMPTIEDDANGLLVTIPFAST